MRYWIQRIKYWRNQQRSKKKRLLCLFKNQYLIDSARIIKVTNKWFILEFDLEENKKLVKDLNNLFVIRWTGQRRVQKKEHGT